MTTEKITLPVSLNMKKIGQIGLISVFSFFVQALMTSILPFTPEFEIMIKENQSNFSGIIAYSFLIHLIKVIIIFCICSYSAKSKISLFISLFFTLFIVEFFNMQIETWYFRKAFPVLSVIDIFLLMGVGILPLVISIFLGIKFFIGKNRQNNLLQKSPFNFISIISVLSVLGIIYTIIYFVFGYFVAWQYKEVQAFYSGQFFNSFSGQMQNNWEAMAEIFPFQFLRGIIFAFAGYLLFQLTEFKTKMFFLLSFLLFIIPGLLLLIHNPLFPEVVRMAHFYEVSTSMILFSTIVSWGFSTSIKVLKEKQVII